MRNCFDFFVESKKKKATWQCLMRVFFSLPFKTVMLLDFSPALKEIKYYTNKFIVIIFLNHCGISIKKTRQKLKKNLTSKDANGKCTVPARC